MEATDRLGSGGAEHQTGRYTSVGFDRVVAALSGWLVGGVHPGRRWARGLDELPHATVDTAIGTIGGGAGGSMRQSVTDMEHCRALPVERGPQCSGARMGRSLSDVNGFGPEEVPF